MSEGQDIRDKVIRSLSAIGAVKDAQFYAELFSSQAPEKFALIVIDPRCLKNPLLEVLISNLKILNDLNLRPILLIGALDSDPTSVRFQTHRLCKDLELAGVQNTRLNTASYALFESVFKVVRSGGMCILERLNQGLGLEDMVKNLEPAKVMFLQPSGAIRQNGERIAVINIDDPDQLNLTKLSAGQKRFLEMVQTLTKTAHNRAVYVIASPLNLLQELFTVKGSGTLIRRGAKLKPLKSLRSLNKTKLKKSIESGFGKPLKTKASKWRVKSVIIDQDYRAGAIFTQLSGLTYLSKFWVVREARGEGLARDVWDALLAEQDKFFWRSRMENPFNDWYLKSCEGMQISGNWRVFWTGLQPSEIEEAVIAAAEAPEDF